MKKLLPTFVLVIAMIVPMCGMAVPEKAVVYNNVEGGRELQKTFTLSPEEDPEKLIEEPFEMDGYSYEYKSMTKEESVTRSTKYVEVNHQIETEDDDTESILQAVPGSIAYSGDDGFSGELILRPATIQTEAKGWETSSYKVSDTKTYTGLAHNDPSLIPQTVTKNGMTLKIAGISWQGVGGSGTTGSLIPQSYTATVQYSTTAYSKYATGYITTAEYGGEVKKEGVESVTYTVVYSGTELEPLPEPVPVLDYVMIGLLGLIALICIVFLGAGFYGLLRMKRLSSIVPALPETEQQTSQPEIAEKSTQEDER